jgi:cell shape-determining protein MreC
MSSESSSRSSSLSIHIPVAILSAAVAIFFGVQLRNTSKQTEIMRWQLSNLDKQTENLKKAQQQFTEALTNSEETVKQADQIQKQYISLFQDLLELSKDDKDAKEIVDKFGIKRTDPPKTEAAPAADAEKKDK